MSCGSNERSVNHDISVAKGRRWRRGRDTNPQKGGVSTDQGQMNGKVEEHQIKAFPKLKSFKRKSSLSFLPSNAISFTPPLHPSLSPFLLPHIKDTLMHFINLGYDSTSPSDESLSS